MMNTDIHKKLHNDALICVKEYQRQEKRLLAVLEDIDRLKTFRVLGYSSLFEYTLKALNLTESQASAFITVMRKSVEVPELKQAINNNVLTVSQAKRITAVVAGDTPDAWIQKAATLSQRSLEFEVAKACPEKAVRERAKPVSAERVALTLGISIELEKKLRRLQDILSQKRQKHCTLEETLEFMVGEALLNNDPLLKPVAAPRHSSRNVGTKTFTPALKRRAIQRDIGQCTHISNGERCTQTRWLQVHHKVPRAMGGKNVIDNLTTHCFHHHKLVHEMH